MASGKRQSFSARAGALPQVRAFVQDRCARMTVAPEAAQRLQLIAEELFINSVTHGYGGDCAASVDLMLRDAGHEMELVVEDTARAFDPFARLPEENPDPRDRPIGGQGLALIARMTSRRSYERRSGGNRTTVAVLKNAPGPGVVQASAAQKKLPTGE
jgi:anti-sigma regulatory factor (Ser/Thr protein kinase)